MRVVWDPESMKARTQVANYIRRQFGSKRKTRFLQEVRQVTQQSKRSPGIGQIDPLFVDRPQTYLSVIINGLNKLVYFVSEDILYIAGFWDTRMDDGNQASNVK